MLAHSFYKALLFLSAGSVIHALDGEQDLKKMGSLRAFMPVTAVTFFVGWLSIAGVPPFSGFWAKSDVLENAWAVSPALWAIGAVTAILTAYYMGREFFLVFMGDPRWEGARPGGEAPRDPGWVMGVPLVVLAACSFLGLFIDLPFHPTWSFLERWLQPVVGASVAVHHFGVTELWGFGLADVAFALVGIAVAAAVWRVAVNRPALEPRVLVMAWFVDWSYDRFVARPGAAISAFASSVVDARVIDGAVEGVARIVRSTGERLRRVQSGYVRTYALTIVGGVVIIVAYLVTRAGS
jgi:NADH-quinone oxidoreductase subunit L